MEPSAENPRRSSSDSSSSSEFEFWMVGKEPSFPQPRILTADELFVDGVLLPLHLLSLSHSNPNSTTEILSSTEPEPETETPPPPPEFSTPSIPPTSSSKRWKDIFKAGERKLVERVRRKERIEAAGNAAELNINIWPFSRSRSAGNAGAGTWNRAKVMVARRKASSAPCSRSNSRGESSKPATVAATATTTSRRRWAPNPGRVGLNAGIHLGRSSPVWQLRRNSKPSELKEKASGSDAGAKKGGGSAGVRMLNLNMNTCIGYRNQVSFKGEDKNGVASGEQSSGGVGVGSNGAGLFNLRTIFSKKVV
ncbi:translation initiation factor IF-2-like [Cocos nucifera]|nr:translation initiation factor IF-2-like [Cocos nucifera]